MSTPTHVLIVESLGSDDIELSLLPTSYITPNVERALNATSGTVGLPTTDVISHLKPHDDKSLYCIDPSWLIDVDNTFPPGVIVGRVYKFVY